MNTEIKLRGGATAGWINATWPLANLNVTPSKTTLNSIFLGKYEFRPEDVTSFEAIGSLPLFGKGIRIHHNIADHPNRMIFWTSKDPDNLIDEIRRMGFIPKGIISPIVRNRGFPIRWQAIIVFIVLWNALLLLDMFRNNGFHPKPGPYAWLATLLVFILSITIWKSELIQKAIISPGHKPDEIKPFLYLLTLVAGFLSLILGMQLIK